MKPDDFLKSNSFFDKAETYDISNGEGTGTVTITDETGIAQITDNLNSLKLMKMKSNDPTVLEYKLTFYNANGDKSKRFLFPQMIGSVMTDISIPFQRAFLIEHILLNCLM